jgi:hypothetical protein
MSLNKSSDFIQVLNNIRKYYTKKLIFSYASSIYYNLFIIGTEIKS